MADRTPPETPDPPATFTGAITAEVVATATHPEGAAPEPTEETQP